MFEPGTGEVLNIPVDFVLFHDEEIADYSEDSLASDFFEEWYESDDGCDIPHDKCVGYKVPIFLNGEDKISNLELSYERSIGIYAPDDEVESILFGRDGYYD